MARAEFVRSAARPADYPGEGLAELALVGRSNVGKSSLINALVRRKVARTSAAPGKTRLANYYRVQRGTASALYLVDLPGYGYARGGDAAAQEFKELTEEFFARRVPMGVLLLVDSRHPRLDSDLEAWNWIRSQGRGAAVVGTKVDKLTRAERARNARELQSEFDVPVPLVSAASGEGLDELWKMIAKLPSQTAA